MRQFLLSALRFVIDPAFPVEMGTKDRLFLRSLVRFAIEGILLVFVWKLDIRGLSNEAFVFIVFRLLVSFLSRILQRPDFLDNDEKFKWGGLIFFWKVFSEVGIFISVTADINISMGMIVSIIILILFRNVSETCSLLAIEFYE